MSSVVQNTVSFQQESNGSPASGTTKKKLDENNNDALIPAKRSKRLKSKPKRYGVFDDDLNDDYFFEQVTMNLSENQSQSKSADAEAEEEEEGDKEKENTSPCEPISEREQGDPDLQLLSPGQKILYRMLMEIKTDVKVLQRTMVNMEVMISDGNAKKKNNKPGDIRIEELHDFSLPLNDENSITDFNSKLKQKDFYEKVYNVLKAVGGDGEQVRGEDVVQKIAGLMFSKQLLSNMSWTGKSSQKEKKKISFKRFDQVIELISHLSNTADKAFKKSDCQRVLVYSVLKYAYRNTADAAAGHGNYKEEQEVVINESDVVHAENAQLINSEDIFIVIPGDSQDVNNQHKVTTSGYLPVQQRVGSGSIVQQIQVPYQRQQHFLQPYTYKSQ